MVRLTRCNKCGAEIPESDPKKDQEQPWDTSIAHQGHYEKDKTVGRETFNLHLCDDCKEEFLKSLKYPAVHGDC